MSAVRRAAAATPAITDAEFRLLRRLVHDEAGIFLSDAKRPLLAGRLARRLRALGLPSYMALYRLAASDAAERQRLLEAVTTHETRFFREPRQFEFLEAEAAPRWRAEAAAGRRPRRLRAWSAGCSTGEEAYSLAMLLGTCLPAAAGWTVEVLATDLSNPALERARQAVWPLAKAGEIPPRHLRAWMRRGVRGRAGSMAASPALKSLVRFERANLNDERPGVEGPFDLVLCRNVLIYFRPDRRRLVVERLLDRLAPGGYVLLGHAESLAEMADRVRSVGPMIYVPHGGPGGPPEPRPR